MLRKLFSPVTVLLALCLVFGMATTSNASSLAAKAYFGLNGIPLLYIQTSVGLNGAQYASSQYLSLYNGKMNTSTRYMSNDDIQAVSGPKGTVITATTLGYGYSLPYLNILVPNDLVRVSYVITLSSNGVAPKMAVTVSSYDHPTLPPFYRAELVLVRGGVVIIP